MTNDYSSFELMSVFLSRQLKDGDVLKVGVALPVVEAAIRLAHLMHGPNMDLVFFGHRMNVAHLHHLPMPAYGWDNRVVRWAESFSDTGHRFERLKDWQNSVFFIGGVQVDMHGNTNLIGVGSDYKKLSFRGPGSVGSPTLSTHIGRYYIVLNSHVSRVLVERCDYISTIGWGDGGPDERRRIGLPGGGPQFCLTPLCIMDFTENEKRMRLHTIHPGVSEADIHANTGFKVITGKETPTTPAPSEEELHVLRTRVDLSGMLRR
ncbi:CoA-transferase [Thermodesulfobacteriota bacterium]